MTTGNTLIIIGNGMASNRILEDIGVDHPFDAIHIFSDESYAHYNRIMLSPLLAQETTLAEITPHDPAWYQQRRITTHLNRPVQRVDTDNKTITVLDSTTGEPIEFHYQSLVFATGSRSSIPPLPGTAASNVLGFRSMHDVDTLLSEAPNIQHATVIGAGLLGVEAAVGLKAQGIDVTLMHRNPVLMNRQLDSTASGILETELRSRGIDVLTGVNPTSLETDEQPGTPSVNRVHYAVKDITGCSLECQKTTQLVVFATGILPNKELATGSGLTTDRGICVNALMQTSAEHVYALGECCQYKSTTYGLVAPIWDQANVVAQQLLHGSASSDSLSYLPRYKEQEHLTKLKVSGVDIHSIGQFNAHLEPDLMTGECDEVIELHDLNTGIYKKLVLNQNRIRGVLCVGDVLDSGWYYELMKQETDITPLRSLLMFGKQWAAA